MQLRFKSELRFKALPQQWTVTVVIVSFVNFDICHFFSHYKHIFTFTPDFLLPDLQTHTEGLAGALQMARILSHLSGLLFMAPQPPHRCMEGDTEAGG